MKIGYRKRIIRITVMICSIIMLSLHCLPVYATDNLPWASFVEAEDGKIKYGNDISVKEDNGAINGKVIATQVETHSLNNAFELTFTVPKDGEYAIWGRVNYPSQSANSLFYQVDGEKTQVIWDFPDEDEPSASCYNTWHYFYLTTRKPVSFNRNSPHGGEYTSTQGEWRHSPNYLKLEAGEHTILFKVRESGWMIDQFVITELKVDEYDPNYCEENNSYLESCKFCNADYWKHYVKDVYAVKNVSAEEYFETAMKHFVKEDEPEPEQNEDVGNIKEQQMDKESAEPEDYRTIIILGSIMLLAIVGLSVLLIKRKDK